MPGHFGWKCYFTERHFGRKHLFLPFEAAQMLFFVRHGVNPEVRAGHGVSEGGRVHRVELGF